MPDWRAIVRARLSALTMKPTTEMDVTEELAQHLEDRYEQLRAAGLTEEAAMTATSAEIDPQDLLRDFGDVFGDD